MTKNSISITFTRDQLEQFTAALADQLCWYRGFRAATPESENHPESIDSTRLLNDHLKDGLSALGCCKNKASSQ